MKLVDLNTPSSASASIFFMKNSNDINYRQIECINLRFWLQESPSYSYGYGVADTHTGDIKTVWEAKEGDTVKGDLVI